MTQSPPPADPPPGINPLTVTAPPTYQSGPNWQGAWNDVVTGNYGGPNKIVPRKHYPWE